MDKWRSFYTKPCANLKSLLLSFTLHNSQLLKFTVDFHSISCHLLHGSYNKQTKNNADNNNSNPNKLLSIHAVHLSFMLTKSCFIQVLLLSFHIAKIRLPDDICLTAWNFLDEKDSIKKATYKHSVFTCQNI
ncbi:hypothetical protein T09_6912 [Trichinella sp. T9]|nr:hypothetical protein T09_6912 [Trichinella sp. T9]